MATMKTKRSSASRDRKPSRRRGRASRRPELPSVDDLYYFDEEAADRVCEFFPRFLVHTKGQWSGNRFELAPWERYILRETFGWKRRADGLRRYRIVYIEIPRKNGKSEFVAGIGLYLLFCDNEPGADVYSAAHDRSQAGLVFGVAKEMVLASVRLRPRCEPMAREIWIPSTRSKYQVLSADVPSKHGLNPHGILFDELHVQDDRDLWDTLRTGRGARRQPLIVAMTTAGYDRKSLCYEMHRKALAVRNGLVRDDEFLPVVYGIQEGDDWEKREVWKRCNPSLGVTISMEYLDAEYREAKQSPAYQNTFRRLHLNEWVQQAFRWIDQKKWRACTGSLPWHELAEKLRGRACYAALDLSTVTDLCALELVFDSSLRTGDPDYPSEEDIDAVGVAKIPGWEYGDPLPAYDVLSWFWCPEEGIRIRSKRDKVSYDAWRDEGALIATDGDAVDHGAIRKKLQDLGQEYLIQELAVDAWNAHKLITELEQEDGFEVVRVSQGFGSMTAPTKELDALYRRGQIRHGGHPVLAWCADNVSLDKDAYDNWKPSKKKSPERIDGIVALVMALGRALLSDGRLEDARLETLG
jgi:phage terminase large subunit-like protein